MTKEATTVVSDVMRNFDRNVIPPALAQQFQRHHENLIGLATSLLQSGKSGAETKDVIVTVLDSFKEELVQTILSLKETDDAI